jgi:hypothetical protein
VGLCKRDSLGYPEFEERVVIGSDRCGWEGFLDRRKQTEFDGGKATGRMTCRVVGDLSNLTGRR